MGTKLWNELTKTVQEAPDAYAFKREINRMNRRLCKAVKVFLFIVSVYIESLVGNISLHACLKL